MWHWYNENVLSKLDLYEQTREFEESESSFESDFEYRYSDDDDYAYDDYESGW